MIPLIDADIIAFSVGFAADKTYYMIGKRKFKYKKKANDWCDKHGHDRSVIIKHHEAGDLDEALAGVDSLVNDILTATEANEARLFLTGKGNFRYDIATSVPYKGNRSDKHRPHHLQSIREHLMVKWEAEEVENQEADDALGIMQSDLKSDETVICSLDKDLLMIPGWHYNWNKKEWTYINEYQGWYNFYKQLLTGDRTDNIEGLPGVGDKTAMKALDHFVEPHDMMCYVAMQYAKHFDDPEYRMLENANLLWIRRQEGQAWNFDIHDVPEWDEKRMDVIGQNGNDGLHYEIENTMVAK